jgi:hypothetical protein
MKKFIHELLYLDGLGPLVAFHQNEFGTTDDLLDSW